MPDNVTLDPPITNIERLLAKAAGMEGISVDDPETRIERYLKAICDRLDNGGGGGSQLPEPTENDVGKVATVVNNEGTYEYGLETPSSGGGPLVVTINDNDEMDKTWQEIHDAMLSRGAVAVYGDNYAFAVARAGINENDTYGVTVFGYDETFNANTPEDYPAVDSGGQV